MILALLLVPLIQASIKPNKNNYNTAEIVFADSNVGLNDYLCRSQSPSSNVKLYVVDHKASWSNGDDFRDVRDSSSEVPNSRFSNVKIWENPKIGTYDLIIDCNNNKKYEDASEPIYSTGFAVIAKKGSVSVLLGENNPKSFSWKYDQEDPDLDVEITQLKLLSKDEDVRLDNLTIKSDLNLKIYLDKNNNGQLNPVDKLIGEFIAENITDEKTISLDYTLTNGIEEKLLFVYNLNEQITVGSYNVKIISLDGTGVSSNGYIKFSGLPIESNELTILDKKTCLGEVKLILEPNPTFSDSIVNAKITNLTGCDNKKVSLRVNECYKSLEKEVGFCVFKNDICEISIKAIKGQYFACIDKNDDNDKNDFGESDSKELLIKIREIKTNGTANEIINKTSLITGRAIEEPGSPGFFQQTPLFILLEVTLLLILFILVLILFSIGRGSSRSETNEEVFESDQKKEDSE